MSALYGYTTYQYSGQPNEGESIIAFVTVMVLGFLCTEEIGHSIGTSLVYHPTIGIFISTCIFFVLAMFANYFIQTKDLPILLQYVSDYIHVKYVFNSGLISIYGLNRCAPEEKSVALLKFGVDDSQALYPNIYKLVIYLVVLKCLTFSMLILKTNFKIGFMCLESKPNEKRDENICIESTVIDFNNDEKKSLSDILLEIHFLDKENNRTTDLSFNEITNETQKVNRICFAWKQLTLRIPSTFFKEEKVILRQISGFFEFGTVNALMGCSGAGKTSLLKSINGLYNEYITNDSIILLSKFRPIRTCFIEQDEKQHLLTGLTTGQAMTYASKLKNSDPLFDHQTNVKNLMKQFLIDNTFDTSVENISGGEQKRLIIAMELTSSVKPNLMCIDEPTSGLDSNAAEEVIVLNFICFSYSDFHN